MAGTSPNFAGEAEFKDSFLGDEVDAGSANPNLAGDEIEGSGDEDPAEELLGRTAEVESGGFPDIVFFFFLFFSLFFFSGASALQRPYL